MSNLYAVSIKKGSTQASLSSGECFSILYHDIFDYPLSLSELIKWKCGKDSFFSEKKIGTKKGAVIIQNPNTGEILAMADSPTFNPNSYSEYEPGNFLNRGVQEIFEPGSSFKPITMAAGLDLGAVTPQTTFNDIGFREEAGYKIKNFSEKVFGSVTMSEVLEKSVNTGVMHVQDLVGNDSFLNYVINFVG